MTSHIASEMLQNLQKDNKKKMSVRDLAAAEDKPLREYMTFVYEENLGEQITVAKYVTLRNYILNFDFPVQFARVNLNETKQLDKIPTKKDVVFPRFSDIEKFLRGSLSESTVISSSGVKDVVNRVSSSVVKDMLNSGALAEEVKDLDGWSEENNDLYAEINTSLADVVSADIVFIVTFFSLLDAYEGFEPVSFWASKVKRWIVKGVIKSAIELWEDMAVIIAHYLTRGTRISSDKVNRKTKQKALDTLSTVKGKYGFMDVANNNPGSQSTYKPDDLTIARLIACVPGLVAEIMAKSPNCRIVGSKPSDLPKYLCFPAGASLIPTSYGHLWVTWLRWSLSFNEVINSNRALKNKQPLKTVFMYGDIARRSNVFNDTARVELLAKLERSELERSVMSGVPLNSPMSVDDTMFLDWIATTEARKLDDFEIWRDKQLKLEGSSSATPVPTLSGNRN